jgi:uncharacterized membrane protein
LGFEIPFDKLELENVVELKQCDPIIFTHYYDNCKRCFCISCTKDNTTLEFLYVFLLLENFKIIKVNMTMEFCGL